MVLIVLVAIGNRQKTIYGIVLCYGWMDLVIFIHFTTHREVKKNILIKNSKFQMKSIDNRKGGYIYRTPPALSSHRTAIMTSSNGINFRVPGPLYSEFPAQRPVMRSFDVFFDLYLNERLSKQSRRHYGAIYLHNFSASPQNC